MVVSYHVGARNQTRVLSKSSWGSYLPSHLCSPSLVFSIRSWPSWLQCGWDRVSYFVNSSLWLVQVMLWGQECHTHALLAFSLMTVITVDFMSASVILYHLNEMLLQVLYQKVVLFLFAGTKKIHPSLTFTTPGLPSYPWHCFLGALTTMMAANWWFSNFTPPSEYFGWKETFLLHLYLYLSDSWIPFYPIV